MIDWWTSAIGGATYKLFARESSQLGIHANCISPVAATQQLLTGLSAQAKHDGATLEEVPRPLQVARFRQTPTPEEVADAILYLYSKAASAVTGQHININCASTIN